MITLKKIKTCENLKKVIHAPTLNIYTMTVIRFDFFI